MPIFINDFDDQLVDWLVEWEITEDRNRRVRVKNEIVNAFARIAPEGIYIRNYVELAELEELAEDAANDWVDRFGSRADRRVALRNVFPKGEAIIATLDKANEILPPTDYYHGGNERTLENGGIFNPDFKMPDFKILDAAALRQYGAGTQKQVDDYLKTIKVGDIDFSDIKPIDFADIKRTMDIVKKSISDGDS